MTKEEKLADKMISEMRADGLSYGQMLEVIRLAKRKFEALMKVKKK